MRIPSLFLALWIFCLAAGHAPALAAGPEDLTYLTEDYFPFNYERDGKLQGLSVDLLKEAWKRMGVAEQPIQLLPWARAYDIVQTEPNTVLFAMARNDSRETLFRWAGPISQARFVLTGLRHRHLQVRDIEELRNYSVGTVIKDISDLLLDPYKDRIQVEPVTSMEYNLKKLVAGRIDLISYEEGAMHRYLIRHGFSPSDFETVFVLTDMDVYYAFHKDTDPALVERFQKALDEIRASLLYQQILDRHLD
ncbi:substrate-binding periplasmic protein [Paucidesulfovibrio longus]|uniref:substrate-binding periplasmic protein n=1 Tax=Paucidesulfovibrio longus TaxID=889 RepID=UPI0003B5C1A7|nr:transporter substrate-binding domain-containing protein [Paucidesulfovibrio longus]